MLAASSPLTKIIPGLMIWTIVFFLIVFFVLKRYAFGAIQKLIDERRDQIRPRSRRPTTLATRHASCSTSTGS